LNTYFIVVHDICDQLYSVAAALESEQRPMSPTVLLGFTVLVDWPLLWPEIAIRINSVDSQHAISVQLQPMPEVSLTCKTYFVGCIVCIALFHFLWKYFNY